MIFESIMNGYDAVLRFVAEFTVHTLELVGICIIIFGSVKAIVQVLTHLRKKDSTSVIIVLGRSLALALEFKMGAEIVNTVIIRDLRELAVLAIVIALRAVLALLIHWEIKTEKDEESKNPERLQQTSSGADETPEK